MEGDIPESKPWEVEKIVGKQTAISDAKKVMTYQVRWLGYGPEYDEWRNVAKLANCKDLVAESETRQANQVLKKPRSRPKKKCGHLASDLGRRLDGI